MAAYVFLTGACLAWDVHANGWDTAQLDVVALGTLACAGFAATALTRGRPRRNRNFFDAVRKLGVLEAAAVIALVLLFEETSRCVLHAVGLPRLAWVAGFAAAHADRWQSTFHLFVYVAFHSALAWILFPLPLSVGMAAHATYNAVVLLGAVV